MNKKIYPVINLLLVGVTIFMSYYSNTGAMNGNTMGSLSNEYDNFFTPASYAFSIWGLIYIDLIGHAVKLFFLKDELKVKTQSTWMSLANLGNIAWVFLWLYEYTALSTLAMAFILFSLVKLGLSTSVENKKQSLWIWWPVSIYMGWITVALAANVSAYLAKIEFEFLLTEPQWALVLILIATAIYGFILVKTRLEYAVFVGTWALIAISLEQWDQQVLIQWTALICAIILFIPAVWSGFKARTA